MKLLCNRKRITSNDKGFTLVELIVCVCIFVLISGAALGFMVTSTKTYKNVNDEVDLQSEAQIAMNQIETLVLNAESGVNYMYQGMTITPDPADSVYTEGFSYSSADIDTSAIEVTHKVLYVYNKENRYVLTYDVAQKELYYREEKRLTDPTTGELTNNFEDNSSTKALLCEYLDDFVITIDTTNPKKVVLDVDMEMVKGERTFSAKQNYFLRNSVALNSNVASIYPNTPAEVTTYETMCVKMNGNTYYSGTNNVCNVDLKTEAFRVPFYVTVMGQGYPSQEYTTTVTSVGGTLASDTGVENQNTMVIGFNEFSSVVTLTCQSKVNPSLKTTITFNVSKLGNCMVVKGSSYDKNIMYANNTIQLGNDNTVKAYVEGLENLDNLNGTPIRYVWTATYYDSRNVQQNINVAADGTLTLPNVYNKSIKIKAKAYIGSMEIASGNSVSFSTLNYNLTINRYGSNQYYFVPYASTNRNWKPLTGTYDYYEVKYHAGGNQDQNPKESGQAKKKPWYELKIYTYDYGRNEWKQNHAYTYRIDSNGSQWVFWW